MNITMSPQQPMLSVTKAIPFQSGIFADVWRVTQERSLQLAIISRIKMFYRPTNLAMAPEEAPAMLRFRRSGSKLTLINPTPYFITVTNMKAGNSNLPNTMVPPKGEVSVDITHAATGDISFQTINDYGALTPRIKATMQ